MSKYFERYERKEPVEYNEEELVDYPEDIAFIRTEVESKYGKLDCSDRKLEDLWRDYSDECWCAGFMSPDEAIVESFVDWLDEQE